MVERKFKTLSVEEKYHTALRKEVAELGTDLRTLVTLKVSKPLSKEDKKIIKMKKITLGLAFALALSVSSHASAAVCGDPKLNHPAVVEVDPVTLEETIISPAVNFVGCGGGGIPSLYTMPWGLTGGQTPLINHGQTVTDEGGIADTCPSWYPTGCYDITKTEYYRSRMKALVAELTAKGWINYFPVYKGWIGR